MPTCLNLHRLLVASVAAVCSVASAQTPELPGALSGHWTWVARGVGNPFALDEIHPQPDTSFTARLTWATINAKCALRNVPIVGQTTADGIRFEATTACGDVFSAELNRSPAGWSGSARSLKGPDVTVELKAN